MVINYNICCTIQEHFYLCFFLNDLVHLPFCCNQLSHGPNLVLEHVNISFFSPFPILIEDTWSNKEHLGALNSKKEQELLRYYILNLAIFPPFLDIAQGHLRNERTNHLHIQRNKENSTVNRHKRVKKWET